MNMALGQYLGAGSGVTKLLYRLNGDATDSSGNANNGTASNVTWANGRVGNQCGSFSSASSSNILSGSAVTLGGSQTFVVWFKTTTTATNSAFLGSWLLGAENFILGVNASTNNGAVRALLTDNNGSTQSATERGSGYNDGKWHKFICTNSGTSQITYVDGVDIGSTSLTIDQMNTTTPVAIGAVRYSNSSTGNYTTSDIDEVVLETGAWSPSSIKKDFTYSKGHFGIL